MELRASFKAAGMMTNQVLLKIVHPTCYAATPYVLHTTSCLLHSILM